MGQKVNPIGLRIGINRTWDSRWFADGEQYADILHEDLGIRKYLEGRLSQAGVSRVVIERPAKKARITIHTARPGVVIGKKGADIEKLRAKLSQMTGSDVQLNIVEIRTKGDLEAFKDIDYTPLDCVKNYENVVDVLESSAREVSS